VLVLIPVTGHVSGCGGDFGAGAYVPTDDA
jgi:hypothetical protein